jgi:hypothetical protein
VRYSTFRSRMSQEVDYPTDEAARTMPTMPQESKE